MAISREYAPGRGVTRVDIVCPESSSAKLTVKYEIWGCRRAEAQREKKRRGSEMQDWQMGGPKGQKLYACSCGKVVDRSQGVDAVESCIRSTRQDTKQCHFRQRKFTSDKGQDQSSKQRQDTKQVSFSISTMQQRNSPGTRQIAMFIVTGITMHNRLIVREAESKRNFIEAGSPILGESISVQNHTHCCSPPS